MCVRRSKRRRDPYYWRTCDIFAPVLVLTAFVKGRQAGHNGPSHSASDGTHPRSSPMSGDCILLGPHEEGLVQQPRVAHETYLARCETEPLLLARSNLPQLQHRHKQYLQIALLLPSVHHRLVLVLEAIQADLHFRRRVLMVKIAVERSAVKKRKTMPPLHKGRHRNVPHDGRLPWDNPSRRCERKLSAVWLLLLPPPTHPGAAAAAATVIIINAVIVLGEYVYVYIAVRSTRRGATCRGVHLHQHCTQIGTSCTPVECV